MVAARCSLPEDVSGTAATFHYGHLLMHTLVYDLVYGRCYNAHLTGLTGQEFAGFGRNLPFGAEWSVLYWCCSCSVAWDGVMDLASFWRVWFIPVA